jgi:oxygen-independent coproporphyrinogen-3 oxidase
MGNHEDISPDSVSVPEVVERPCGLYPRLEAFSSDYGADDYCDWVEQSNGDPLPAPLVLYLQNATTQSLSSSPIPPDSPNGAGAIERELRLQGALFDADRPLQQLILSGSIATSWSDDQLYRLVAVIQSSFFINQDSLNSWCACTGGLVPSAQRLRLLRVLGFNHVRLMPDDSLEQHAAERLVVAVDQARQLGFDKAILDLRRFAGGSPDRLPLMDAVLAEARPERVRVFPVSGESHSSMDQRMASHGYRNIGLDWYLRDEDRWWRARASDRLYWTPLGYSELYNPDIIGVGPGALSAVCEFYGINATSLQRYSMCVDEGIVPIVQGTELENSDVLRREVIAMILASSSIRVSAIEKKWGIQFDHFFASESALLRAFELNNWLHWQDDRIEIKARGVRELDEICGVFDGRAGNSLAHACHPASSKSPEYS